MKALQWLLAGFFLIVLDVTAVGQSNPAPTAYPPDAPISAMMISSPGWAGHGVHGVKGSPFSADVYYEFTQVLAGENRIHRESHGKIFRDGEGRIRNEIQPETPPGPSVLLGTTITINDPVSQTMITLYPEAVTKSAVIDHMSRYYHELGIGIPIDNSPASGNITPTELLERLKALQQAQQPAPAAIGNQQAQRPVPGARGRKPPGEELGAKEIEGFTALGIRSSGTIPAGQIGNEKPLVTVDETWWSEDLKAVLVSIYDNPQFGRRVMRLTNIQVGEPGSYLFQIPPDYTVREFPVRSNTTAKPPQQQKFGIVP